jgi:hypothetical protein
VHRGRKLEQWLQSLAVPHLTLLLIFGQVAAYLLWLMKPEFIQAIELLPNAVMRGEWWRLVTFIIVPTDFFLLNFIIGTILFYVMGSGLEEYLGTLRFNLFFGLGCLLHICFALVIGFFQLDSPPISNWYLYASVYLAFAWLYPEFKVMLYYILPLKLKWIAWGMLALYVNWFSQGIASFGDGGWFTCTLIVIGNLNWLFFFGRNLVAHNRLRAKQLNYQIQEAKRSRTPRHVCCVCQANNLTHPDRDFRYCTECAGTPAYCDQHLTGHVHRTAEKV